MAKRADEGRGDRMADMSEFEKMRAGLEYRYDDPEVARQKDTASVRCARLNACDPLDAEGRDRAARELLGSAGEGLDIQPGFHCDCGRNITVGRNFTANYNVTILDIAPVTMGDNVMIGPGTLIASVGHPLDGARRRKRLAQAEPITIGSDVWIGGNVTITQGVTIGDNVVVGAGAVVTHDVESNSVVAGVPARVIRRLDPSVGEDPE